MENTCRVTTPAKPAEPENGDVLCAPQFLSRIGVSVEDLTGKRLVQTSGYRGFDGLASLGVDATTLQGRAFYDCPWSGNRYYWMFPLGIITTTGGIERYGRNLIGDSPWRCRVISRSGDVGNVDPSEFDGIVNAMLGHGYTEGTLPSDGCGEKVLATVPLDNGDEILVACWVWFNR